MEKNTILLSLEAYNELRDFKKNIEDGRNLVIKTNSGLFTSTIKYYTNDQVLSEMHETNLKLQDEIKKITTELNEKTKKIADINEPKPITIEDLKKMSYREFKKWKRNNN